MVVPFFYTCSIFRPNKFIDQLIQISFQGIGFESIFIMM